MKCNDVLSVTVTLVVNRVACWYLRVRGVRRFRDFDGRCDREALPSVGRRSVGWYLTRGEDGLAGRNKIKVPHARQQNLKLLDTLSHEERTCSISSITARLFFALPPPPAPCARALPTDLDQISHHARSQKPQTPPMEAGRPSALLRFASERMASQLALASSSRLGVIDSGVARRS